MGRSENNLKSLERELEMINFIIKFVAYALLDFVDFMSSIKRKMKKTKNKR